jgi:hypothetical protein
MGKIPAIACAVAGTIPPITGHVIKGHDISLASLHVYRFNICLFLALLLFISCANCSFVWRASNLPTFQFSIGGCHAKTIDTEITSFSGSQTIVVESINGDLGDILVVLYIKPHSTLY